MTVMVTAMIKTRTDAATTRAPRPEEPAGSAAPRRARPWVEKAALGAVLLLGAAGAAGCSGARSDGAAATGEGLRTERRIADAMYAVLASDRAIYTREVVDRLQNHDKVMNASEHFREEKLLPLPAQMLRMSAEEIRKRHRDLAVALLSPWPINRQNAAHTDVEKAGLEAVAKNPDQPFTGEETLGKSRYFTAVYADRAVSEACVSCHNKHDESPRHDFKLGDVLGGIVIRVAVGT